MLCSGPVASLSVNRPSAPIPSTSRQAPVTIGPGWTTPGHSIHDADGAVSVVQGVFFAAVKGQVLFLASRPDRGLRAVFPLAGAMECRTDNPCDRISTVPGSPASHRTAPAGFAALRGGIGRRDRGGIFGTAGAQTGVRVPDSDGGEVTPATRGTTTRQLSTDDRSTKAGVETPATHAPDEQRVAHSPRSTKAGVETPATPW